MLRSPTTTGAITSSFADRDRFRAAWTGENASDYDFSADAAQLAWVSAIKGPGRHLGGLQQLPALLHDRERLRQRLAGTDPWADQIRRDSLDTFATYLKTVVEHVEDTQGISFDTIDPLNEPNTNYWGTHDRWRRLAHEREQAGGCPRRPRAAGRRDQGARR